MNSKIYILVVIITALLAFMIYKKQQLDHKINRELHNFQENLNIGIVVKNLTTNQTLYYKNGDRYFTPASNIKLFTAFAAMHILPPSFRYTTQLYADLSKLNDGILNEAISLKFSGDPTLTLDDLNDLIKSLAARGVTTINGDFIIDDSIFDQAGASPGTAWDDTIFCFGAPISAININHNCATAILLPASTGNSPTHLIYSEPHFAYIDNEIMTTDNNQACTPEVNTTTSNGYRLTGCINQNEAALNLNLAIRSPRQNAMCSLQHLLEINHIRMHGEFKFNKINQTPLFATVNSEPLAKLIASMLKNSDNLIANALFKTMGSKISGEAGNWKNGQEAMQLVLKKHTSINIQKIKIIDGDGASRYNSISPDQMINLLTTIYHSPLFKEFDNALAVNGVDGTLEHRMQDKRIVGKVHAKTGTETGVTALSGYFYNHQDQVIAFSIIINGFIDPAEKYKKLEDKICQVILDS